MIRLAKSKIHFIGIGGIGMSGLAELLNNMGAKVTGSDQQDGPQVIHLKSKGIPIRLGHRADHIAGADLVVYSGAIPADNVEMLAAKKQRIPLIGRAEALAELMRSKRGVAVAGTHGKTTTTSLMAGVFLAAQVDPTIVVGGRLDLFQSTSKLGDGDWLIAEADESDGSFHRLAPEMVVITNIDDDHLDYYGSFENLEKSFFEFASHIPFYGVLIVCGDDPNVQRLFEGFNKRKIYYGFDKSNDYILRRDKGYYEIVYHGISLTPLKVPIPGEHNALNSLAAIVTGIEAGFDVETCVAGVEAFQGVDRRFQHKGQAKGIDFYDDYGHHPTEIKATLAGFREKYEERRLVVLFQPHRYSRTESCWEAFKESFVLADKVLMLDIYPAGEKPIAGIDSENLAASLLEVDGVYAASGEQGLLQLKEELREGDIFLSLGAGDVWRWGEKCQDLFSDQTN